MTAYRRPYRDSPVHDHGAETLALLAIVVIVGWIALTAFADAIKVDARPMATTRHLEVAATPARGPVFPTR